MKYFLVAPLTFFLGVIAVGAFRTIDRVEPTARVAIDTPAIAHQVPFAKRSTSRFFDSFRADEFFNGWLIADEFPGMSEVWTILLDRDAEVGWTSMVLTEFPDGTPNDDADFSSVTANVDGDVLSFRTKTYRSVHYEFRGRFIVPGHDFEPDQKVLRGTLKKFRKGRLVAHFTADFRYFEPHCFH